MKKNSQRAFIKYDSRGRIVPGVLIVRDKMPNKSSGGFWVEVDFNYCCPITTTTTTSTTSTSTTTTTTTTVAP